MQVPLAPKQSECADESDESEEVVAMQMRDKYCLYAAHGQSRPAQLYLSTLGAVH